MMTASIRTAILLSLSLILAVQVSYLPVGLSGIFTLMLVLLWLNFRKQTTLSKTWVLLLTIIALAVIYFSYQSFLGVEAGVSVLSTFLFAKAFETKTKRDLIILFNFALFVAASTFLFSQSFIMTFGILLCLLSCLIGLYRVQTSEFGPDAQAQERALRQDAKHVGKFILYALPFFILLFIFFPRLPPMWHIPIPEKKGVTGISDRMSPGDIAELSQSSALAFRIIGDIRKLPPRSELYWRALVLDEYDGQTWISSAVNQQPQFRSQPDVNPLPAGWDYQYLASDPSVLWVMGLEKSIPLERRYYSRYDWGIVPRRLTQRMEPIHLRWIGTQVKQPVSHSNYLQQLNTRTPAQFDPKTQALAVRLAKQSESPQRYIQNVLNWYRQNQFVYTLTPGTLGQNRVDEFLFQTRRGFCEHFASSFVMLMRYAGIPARVVTGYQGGSLAPDGKSWEVRQMDAHAWTEVWVNNQWQRIDPTAMIAPQRIDEGMQHIISQDETVLGEGKWAAHYQMLTKLRIWSDYASYQWQSKVVGYNAESQRSWMSKLGLHSAYAAVWILIASMLLLMISYFLWIYVRNIQQRSPFEHAISRLEKSLSKHLHRQSAETFRQWMQRLSTEADIKQSMVFQQAVNIYERSQYADQSMDSKDISEFNDLLKKCAYIIKSQGKNLSSL
ncbi:MULTISPECIES: DUF3488 and transglutaminase-like domain-containing protein [unclassified Acinetobacter]|uniref:transglutaminase family protein n=1 Tax=Acinetobacter TaxID=469 RepID=UPI0005384938|nr:DUF3488 and transglutaminase-like domain-containing protein [Acinetobacter sp. HR7]KGT46330.1 hypothetical protein GW12_26540 [Acinetobacter sp. HR7]